MALPAFSIASPCGTGSRGTRRMTIAVDIDQKPPIATPSSARPTISTGKSGANVTRRRTRSGAPRTTPARLAVDGCGSARRPGGWSPPRRRPRSRSPVRPALGDAEIGRDRGQQADRHELRRDQHGHAERHRADRAPGGARSRHAHLCRRLHPVPHSCSRPEPRPSSHRHIAADGASNCTPRQFACVYQPKP